MHSFISSGLLSYRHFSRRLADRSCLLVRWSPPRRDTSPAGKNPATGYLLLGLLLVTLGCRSPYRSDQGALFGGVTGAGLGAIIGETSGNPEAGALIGGAAGAITGAAIGGELDEIEAQNRAQIASQLGRPVAAGGATLSDVVAMTQAGVSPQLIANHIQHNGVAKPLTAADLIYLKEQNVADSVIETMQNPPPRAIPVASPRPVVVEEYHHYGPPPRPHFYYRHHYRRPRTRWGVSISN